MAGPNSNSEKDAKEDDDSDSGSNKKKKDSSDSENGSDDDSDGSNNGKETSPDEIEVIQAKIETMQKDIDEIKSGDIIVAGGKGKTTDGFPGTEQTPKSEGHVSIDNDMQFKLIREDIEQVRKDLEHMIGSCKTKCHENEKRIKFVEDWKAYNVKDLNFLKKKIKDLLKKQEDEEKGFNDSIMNV